MTCNGMRKKVHTSGLDWWLKRNKAVGRTVKSYKPYDKRVILILVLLKMIASTAPPEVENLDYLQPSPCNQPEFLYRTMAIYEWNTLGQIQTLTIQIYRIAPVYTRTESGPVKTNSVLIWPSWQFWFRGNIFSKRRDNSGSLLTQWFCVSNAWHQSSSKKETVVQVWVGSWMQPYVQSYLFKIPPFMHEGSEDLGRRGGSWMSLLFNGIYLVG